MTIFILSALLGLLSVANKVLLLKKRREGWLSGMLIGVVSAAFFYVIGLEVLAFAEAGFFCVMLYGLVVPKKPSRVGQFVFNSLLTIATVALSIALFNGVITISQLVSSAAFIWGGYALAIDEGRFGWLLFLVAHLATAVASYYAGQELFAGLQLLSASVCIFALAQLFKHRVA